MSELALREGKASESLDEIHRLAGEAADSMQGIIWLVRQGDAPTLSSLMDAMRQSAETLLKGTRWNFECDEDMQDTPTASLDFHRQVFLFFREALHNIQRHASATQVHVEVSWKAECFHLRIEDNGCGFDVATVKTGQGLANLRHRAGVIGGTLQVDSERGKGTRITLQAPFA
jgi:signal transduction histidine kinase